VLQPNKNAHCPPEIPFIPTDMMKALSMFCSPEKNKK
jgi:hypothetical protein